MDSSTRSSRLLLHAVVAIGGSLVANTVSAVCPIAAELRQATLDGAELQLATHNERMPELERAQCQLVLAARQIQSRAAVALQRSEQALKVIGRLGSRHEHSDALSVHAGLRLTQGEDPEILALLETALKFCDEDLDCQAERLLGLATFDLGTKQFAGARKRIEEAMAIIREQHGDEHALLAEAMQNLSQVAYRQGKYDEELTLLQSAYVMQQRLLAADDPAIATTALQLGFSLADRGRYDEALPLYRQSLDIRLKTLGEDHVDTAQSMLAVGSISILRGEYVLALKHIEKASAIREKLLPPGHANLSTGYIQLAHLQERMGDKSGAERTYRRVLRIAEAKDDYTRQFIAWQGLAGIAFDRGEFAIARTQLQQSLALMVKQNYTSHSWEAGRYMLAEIFRELGETRAALALYKKVLAERSASRPVGDAQVARCGMAVALLEVELGDENRLAKARAALADFESALGSLHPELEELQTRLATVLAAQGQINEAMLMALKALDVRLNVLAETAVGLSESEALRFAEHDIPALNLAIILALEHPEEVAVEPVWDRLASMRDLVLRRVAGRVAMSKASADPSTADAAQALQASSDRYVQLLLLKNPDGLDSTWGKQLELARNERDHAERELARLIPPARTESSIPIIALREELTANQVLVSMATMRRDKKDFYVAMLAGKTLKPTLIEIGSAAGIDALLMQWRGSMQQGVRQPEGMDASIVGAEMSERLLQPILKVSGEATEFLVLATGALHLLPWAALPSRDGKALVETGPVVRLLNREAELVKTAPTTASLPSVAPGSGLLALGGAHFGQAPKDVAVSACASFARHAFVPLPGTAAEIGELHERWPSWHPQEPIVALTGNDASEARFRADAPGKRVLHLATHAFFSDPQSCRVDTRLSLRGVGAVVSREPGDRVALSGLALSNANQRQQLPSSDDGILAAEEIAMMDLRGVELAVLSACDTGLGTLTSTEGVIGLRRAFRLAGVRNLVTSLWKMGDDDALVWMRAFYVRSAETGSSVGLAAWKASADVLTERKAKGLDLNPVHWAGFVATGN